MFFIWETPAQGELTLRLEWWGLMGQPVESYSMKWNVAGDPRDQAKLFRPLVASLPGNGDMAKYPAVAEKFGALRSTDAAMRVEFLIRAPKKAIKGKSYFTNCDANYCYAKGMRDLDRGDLPMGRIGRWNTELSPKTPSDEIMAVWLMVGCEKPLECQRNTLNAGTHMAITKLSVWKLKYDQFGARALLKDWAVLAQEDSPDVANFRRKLAEMVAPRGGTEPDAEFRASSDLIHYSGKLTEMNPIKAEAQALDLAVEASGNRAAGNRYLKEWQAAVATLNRLHKQAGQALAQARLSDDISPEQVARLKALEQDYAREELAVSRADGPVEATEKPGLEKARAEKLAALEQAREPLTDKAAAIDALKREWDVFNEELAHTKRAADFVGSLQRDLALIDGKLAALDRELRKEAERLAEADDDSETTLPAIAEADTTKFEIVHRNGGNGVVSDTGETLIPFRNWQVVSYANGRAEVRTQAGKFECSQAKRSNRPRKYRNKSWYGGSAIAYNVGTVGQDGRFIGATKKDVQINKLGIDWGLVLFTSDVSRARQREIRREFNADTKTIEDACNAQLEQWAARQRG
ncbi:hypothetical protein [Erythrobacter litoralis]|nr:hypothetical protein [Erythrobacter litoralis]